MAEFHFLRPWWLIALPLGLIAIWRLLGGRRVQGGWRGVVDAPLQPFVLALPDQIGERRMPLVLAALAWTAASLALAGPTWERLPVPAFRSGEALVVALDLSRSMDAGDLEPSRLEQAKLKLLSLLERRESGQTALVVYSAHAFTVTPLTTDTATIASLVNALYTDIMPSQGSYPEAGLERSAELLKQTGLNEGTILLITDAGVSPQSLDVANDLGREGYVVSVLAVGTEEGAPIPDPEGGFMSDGTGQVVVPRLDTDGLRRLARAGGGRFARLTGDDRDLDHLFPSVLPGDIRAIADEQSNDYEADVWRDEGVWLALALLPLVALGFRRGWVAAWVACAVVLSAPAPEAQAFELTDLFLNRDQRGYDALEAEDAERAAELFKSPDWRAAAQYRAGDYAASIATLSRLDTAGAHYNRGNALARTGQLEPAIQAYERALELEPGHTDAEYNRELLRELLEQSEQQNQQSDEDQQSARNQGEQGEQESGQQQSDGSEPEGQDGETEPGGSPSQSASTEGDGGGRDDEAEQDARSEATESPGPRLADAGDEQGGEGEREEREGESAQAPGPDELEQWASEQAAEQWLRRVPQDPGGLLRRKFLYQYQRLGLDQEGNFVWPGDEAEPW